ncbi:VOC family protein [Salininema proteolyticum]|uniref:VOC family protein n=1 Tax=Salininema proteolyticum TaxID=1607685 RepID=A0ABV8TXP0_9ACTN
MTAPNMFIVYVSDAPEAARFYGDLFDMKPSIETPGFISFELVSGMHLALWRPYDEKVLAEAVGRTSEVCLAVEGAPASVDATYEEWKAKGVTIVSEPEDAPFGRTFLAADPDGNLIRVAPVD